MTDKLQCYTKAGKILADALNYAITITEPGKKLIDIAEEVENRIKSNSAEPAFPFNISINEIAAHYSPILNDNQKIPENSIVKIDMGVSVEGYIADAARTVIFDKKYEKLKESTEKALHKVLSEIKPGSSIYKVGEIAEKSIKNDSFKVIVNLSGH